MCAYFDPTSYHYKGGKCQICPGHCDRYAHIKIELQNETNTTFNLVSADLILINLNVNDLEKLNVSYISTPNDLESLSNENITFEKIYEKDSYKIYHLKYN